MSAAQRGEDRRGTVADLGWILSAVLLATAEGGASTAVDLPPAAGAAGAPSAGQAETVGPSSGAGSETPSAPRRGAEAGGASGWALEAGGWTQVSLLLFPDALAEEAGDALMPSRLSAEDGRRRERWRLSARDTRLHLGAHGETTLGTVRVHAEGDLFGPAPGVYRPRLRRALTEWTSPSGRWRLAAGQDWSAFADPEAFASNYNPVQLGAVFLRQPQVRLTFRPASGWALVASAESGEGDAAVTGNGPMPALDRPLDLAVAARLERPWGAVQLGALRPATGSAWGATLSGRVSDARDPGGGEVRFQVAHGRGFARYVGGLGPGFDLRPAAPSGRSTPHPQISAANVSYARRLGRRISAAAQASYTAVRSEGRRATTVSAAASITLHAGEGLDIGGEYAAVRASRVDGTVVDGGLLRLAVRVGF